MQDVNMHNVRSSEQFWSDIEKRQNDELAARTALTADQTAYLVRLYSEEALPVDKLPYTEAFNRIVSHFKARFKDSKETAYTHGSLYRVLIKMRKKGDLIKKPGSRRVLK